MTSHNLEIAIFRQHMSCPCKSFFLFALTRVKNCVVCSQDSIKFFFFRFHSKRFGSAAELFRSCVCAALVQLHVALDVSTFHAHYSNLGACSKSERRQKRLSDAMMTKTINFTQQELWCLCAG